ncbi:efflux RND transporter periplasmic adaptor subunit [Persephonella sp.]
MSKLVKALIFFIIVALLVVGGIRLVKIRKEQVSNLPTPERPVYLVEGATVKKGSITVEDKFLGLFRPYNTVEVTSKVSGYVKKIHVKTGQHVKKGDILVSIDDTPVRKEIQIARIDIENLQIQLDSLRAKKEAVETDLKTKENIYRRDSRLYEKKAISREALERSYTAYMMAQAQLEEVKTAIKNTQNKIKQLKDKIESLKNELSYLQIKSPVNGIVQRINFREGNLVVPGKPVLNVESSERYEIVVKLPPDYPVSEGDKMTVDFGGEKKELKVMMVCPATSPEFLKVIKTRIGYKPDGVVSNSLLNVSILKSYSGYVVPANAVFSMTDGDYILVAEGDRFTRLPVKVIATDGRHSVIQGDGIQEGMAVAVGEESKLRLLSLGKKGKVILKESK